MPHFNCFAFWGLFDCGPFSNSKININAMLWKTKKKTRIPRLKILPKMAAMSLRCYLINISGRLLVISIAEWFIYLEKNTGFSV